MTETTDNKKRRHRRIRDDLVETGIGLAADVVDLAASAALSNPAVGTDDSVLEDVAAAVISSAAQDPSLIENVVEVVSDAASGLAEVAGDVIEGAVDLID